MKDKNLHTHDAIFGDLMSVIKEIHSTHGKNFQWEKYKGVDVHYLTGLIIAQMREDSRHIKELKAKNKKLHTEVEYLRQLSFSFAKEPR